MNIKLVDIEGKRSNYKDKLNTIVSRDMRDNSKLFGYVYSLGEEHDKFLLSISNTVYHNTGLDHSAFPSSIDFEKSVINWTKDLLNCTNGTGSISSGGTESIILAMKAIRDKNKNPNANVIIPISAHPAFIKACTLLAIKYKTVDVDPVTYKAIPSLIESAVDDNTISLVASAPSYGVGVIDPIREIGEIAVDNNIDFVVDGCMGSMVLPFIDMGHLFDFSIPGVSVITCDYHKFGYSMKGCSSVIYRDKEMLNYQTFTLSSWIGYSITNTGLQNTKSTSALATMHANIEVLGNDGYTHIHNTIMKTTRYFLEQFEDHLSPDLYLIGNPDMNIMSISSKTIDIFKLAEVVRSKGWFIQAQYGYFNIVDSFHISIGYQNVGSIDKFIEVLLDSIIICKERNCYKSDTPVIMSISERDTILRSNLINNLTGDTNE